jgi:hypothetical protein
MRIVLQGKLEQKTEHQSRLVRSVLRSALSFCLVIALSSGVASRAQLSGDPTAQNLNLSELESERKVPLVIVDPDTPLGVFRHEAQDGIILMGNKAAIQNNLYEARR